MRRIALVLLCIAVVWVALSALFLSGCSVECDAKTPCGNYQLCVSERCVYSGGYSTGTDAGARRDGGG